MLTKVFQSGNSQAVRIPVDFRFDVDTVEILNGENGDVILRPTKPKMARGDQLFAALAQFDDDVFALAADRNNEPPQERDTL
ncbi:antitoxin [Neisseriaceae bacterium B1]